jgi:hypothetical protein
MSKLVYIDGVGEAKVLAADSVEGGADLLTSDQLVPSFQAVPDDLHIATEKLVHEVAGSDYASITFYDSADEVYAVMPPNVLSFHVFNSYASTGAPVLQVGLASGGGSASVSTSSGSPTSASSYAGQAVKFTMSGASSGVKATFGLKLSKV